MTMKFIFMIFIIDINDYTHVYSDFKTFYFEKNVKKILNCITENKDFLQGSLS